MVGGGGGGVGAEQDVHGEGVGFRDLDPFSVALIFLEGNKLKRGGGGGPSHDYYALVPIQEGVTEKSHFVSNRFRVGLGGADAREFAKRFLKTYSGLPVSERELDRHRAEGGGPVGAGAFFLLSLSSAERPPRNSMFSTQERASSTKRIGSRVSLSFFAQVSLTFWSRSIEKLFEKISQLDREAGPRFIPKTTDSNSDFSRAAISSFFSGGDGLRSCRGGAFFSGTP
jgi:hypothetical protein